MLNYGFELEGFYRPREIMLPPKEYPHDDFPGLIEVRNNDGGGSLKQQLYLLLSEADSLEDFDYTVHEHNFSGKEKQEIRKRQGYKGEIDVQNIYGLSPKDIKGKTIASFQISISNTINVYTDKENKLHTNYGLFDYVQIIRNLDIEFKEEIKLAKRQPGFYAIKDRIRVEYRSLPNFVFENDLQQLCKRIQKCV